MKRIAVVFLVVLLVGSFAFVGCRRQRGSDEFRVDVFWYTFADTFLASVRNAMIDQGNAMSNLRITHHDATENQTLQLQMIQTAITQGTNLLVVNIVTTGSEDTAMNIVNQARNARIPIIFFNREVSDAVIRSYTDAAFVGTDADEAGVMQGEAIANFLLRPANWTGNRSNYDLNGDGVIRYIMLRGEHGNAEAYGRTLYAVTEANAQLASAGVKLVPSPANETSTQYEDDGISNYFLYANWSAAEAANLMRTALTAHSLTDGSIELVLANNDDAALGAIEAMNEVGFNTGDDGSAGYIPIFGVDATDVARDAIEAGRMTGTILQDGPAMAAAIAQIADNVAKDSDLLAGTSFNMDDGVAKIRIPYAIVSGGAVSAGDAPAVAEGGSINVDVFWYTFADTFLASVRNSMDEQLAGNSSINYTMHDCEDNQATQTEMIQTAIIQGTDLLVVNIVTTGSEETAINIVNMARDAGIPIIFFNREVSNEVINSYDQAIFVGTDADEAGYMQGEAVANFLLSGDNLSRYDVNGDGEISYIMLRGEHGNAEAFGRTLYAVTEANSQLASAGVKLVPSPANETSSQYDDDGISNYFLYANWSAAIAADLMNTALTAHSPTDGSIELILANNDDAALGAIEALNEIGFNSGNADNYIPVFGVDATAVAVDAISAGRMTGTILQDGPAMGSAIIALAMNVAAGESVTANTGSYNMDAGVAKIRIPYAIVS